jgi:photosystem II stability/assembly factor-like uncharacterized protein
MLRFHSAIAIVWVLASSSTLATLSTASATAMTWQWTSPDPQGNSLSAVVFEDASIGYAVGEHGAVLRTNDGGASWSIRSQAPALSADLVDLLVLAPGELLAVGGSPGIFRSHDGGATWAAVANPSTRALRDVAFTPGASIAAVGDSGQVLHSSDGGVTWSRLTTAIANKTLRVQVWRDALHAIVGGDFVLRETADGGQTWNPLPGVGANESEVWNDGFFIDAQVGELVADFHTLRTVNGGQSWAASFVANPQVYQAKTVRLSGLHWFRASHLEGASIFETIDGGHTWTTRFEDFSINGILDLVQSPDGSFTAVGTEGSLVRSTNGGQAWDRIDACDCPTPRPHISQIVSLPDGRAFAGTTQPGVASRAFLRSDDQGHTWAPVVNAPPLNFLNAMHFPGDQIGFAAGGSGTANVWRSIDGGVSWNPVPLSNPPFANCQVLRFAPVNENTTWAVVIGSGGSTMYRTSDAGATWLPQNANLPLGSVFLRCAYFRDALHGWAGGGSGSVPTFWRTIDGGASWTVVATSGLPAPIGDLRFADDLHGLAAMFGLGGLFRTEDGGATWTQVSSVAVKEFRFRDALHGWASTSTGGIALRTDDGGETWEEIDLPMADSPQAVAPFDGGVIIGGAVCQLLRGEDAQAVGITPRAAPSELKLDAFPHAGSAFKLRFAVPTSDEAELGIFDLQGRRVARLARGAFEPRVEIRRTWNGRADDGRLLPAGAYFARLQSQGRAVAVRVALIR